MTLPWFFSCRAARIGGAREYRDAGARGVVREQTARAFGCKGPALSSTGAHDPKHLELVEVSGANKPGIVFVSEESCPFCAAERWSLAVALSHFSSWSQLGVTKSAATDVFPNTATLSFRTAGYQSTRLTLRSTELTDNAGHPLQALSALDRQVIGRYDVPPYVNSADQSGAAPFLDIGSRYVLAGAQYDPQVLAGLSAAQIAAQLRNPSSPVAQAIDGSAKVIVAAINQLLHDQAGQG